MNIWFRILAILSVCTLLVAGFLLSRPDVHTVSASEKSSLSLLEAEPDDPRVRLAAGEFNPLALESVSAPDAEQPFDYYLVQFNGPIASPTVEALKATGAQVFDYIPDFTFIVKMNSTARVAVEEMPQVRWVGGYQSRYRLDRELLAYTVDENPDAELVPLADGRKTASLKTLLEDEPLELIVTVFPGEDLNPIVDQIVALGGAVLDQTQTTWKSTLKVSVAPAQLVELSALPGVRWIEKAPDWKLSNNEASDIMGAREVWNTYGLYGTGQVVAICDTGLDKGSSDPDLLHDDFEDGAGNARVVEIYDRVGDGASDVKNGHGTHVAGSVLGNGARSGATPSTHTYPESAYAGIAPEASLVFQSIENNANGALTGIPMNLYTLFNQAAGSGAAVHTNSWGSTGVGAYSTSAEDIDQYVWDHPDFTILFSTGNEGVDSDADGVIDTYSTADPATAKNIISVGASENNRPGMGTWFGDEYPVAPILGDPAGDNIDGMAPFSSRGPTLDGRYKPDIVAPGTFIASVKSQAFDCDDAVQYRPDCGWKDIDENYMYLGGTSMSTPLAAGAAAIVRQYYTDIMSATPSAALIKATLANGATNMAPGQYGAGATQEIPAVRPNNVSGWGRINLEDSLFPTEPRTSVYYDEKAGLNTGETDTYTLSVSSADEPLRVTLAWSDYPGSPAAAGGLVHDLDLMITGPDDTTYYPNNAVNRGASQLLAYDDGIPKGVYTWEPGIRVAMRFTPLSYPAKLQTGAFYVGSYSGDYPKTFNWYVYDGNDMAGPDSLLASGATTIRRGGWHAVDLSGENVTMTSGDFFLALELPDSDFYWAFDDVAPVDRRAWDYFGGGWLRDEEVSGDLADFMFNAVLLGPENMTQYDRVNNMVEVDIDSPPPGDYVVTISGYNVPHGPQPYALVASGALFTENTPPVITELPDLLVHTDVGLDNAIDLWAYVNDSQDADVDLGFTLVNTLPVSAGIRIDAQRYIDIEPVSGYTGTVDVEVEVQDTEGLTATDAFQVEVTDQNIPPTLSLPNAITLTVGTSTTLDLWTYAYDLNDPTASLSFKVNQGTSLLVDAFISNEHFLNVIGQKVGQREVEVQVQDPGGMTAKDTLAIFVERGARYIYLPLVIRCSPVAPYLQPISNADGDGRYTLSWTWPSCGGTPTLYEYEVAQNPDFIGSQNGTVDGTYMEVQTLAAATYYWRVRASVGGELSAWSNIQTTKVGAFAYLYVYNYTGGTLRLEIVDVETRSFAEDYEDYWRSVPLGKYTLNAWAWCGTASSQRTFNTVGEYPLEYSCAYNNAFLTSFEPAKEMEPSGEFPLMIE